MSEKKYMWIRKIPDKEHVCMIVELTPGEYGRLDKFFIEQRTIFDRNIFVRDVMCEKRPEYQESLGKLHAITKDGMYRDYYLNSEGNLEESVNGQKRQLFRIEAFESIDFDKLKNEIQGRKEGKRLHCLLEKKKALDKEIEEMQQQFFKSEVESALENQ